MTRQLVGVQGRTIRFALVAFVLFQIVTVYLLPLVDIRQRAVHVGIAVVLVLCTIPARKRASQTTKIPVWDLVACLLVIAASAKIFIEYMAIYEAHGEGSIVDIFLGIGLLIAILEATRRTTGIVFTVIVIVALAYTLGLGSVIPGKWGFPGLSFPYVINTLYRSSQGIYGSITGISAMVVAIFIIYGSLLLHTGGGESFIDLANALAGRFRGGPAKIAVIASAFFGMISGSSIANVVTTGSFTIPLMKKVGYRPAFAASVESSASTVGLITPPIMGSAAFIMVELTGISYLRIIYYAIFPVLLYYLSIFLAVDAEALHQHLAGLPAEQRPSLRSALNFRKLGGIIISVIGLLLLLLAGFSIQMSGFAAIMLLSITFLLSNLSNIRKGLLQLVFAMQEGGRALLQIVPLLVSASIVVHLLGQCGLGIKFVELLTDIGHNSIFLALPLGMMAVVVLGMGLPASACYVLTAAIVAPALLRLGLELAPVHLFLLYFSALAPITPPVCGAVMVACGIAREPKWLKAAFLTLKISFVAFFVPFFFVISPTLIGIGAPADIAIDLGTAILGVVLLSTGFFGSNIGRLNVVSRLFAIVAGVLLLLPQVNTIILAIPAVGLMLISTFVGNKVSGYTSALHKITLSGIRYLKKK